MPFTEWFISVIKKLPQLCTQTRDTHSYTHSSLRLGHIETLMLRNCWGRVKESHYFTHSRAHIHTLLVRTHTNTLELIITLTQTMILLDLKQNTMTMFSQGSFHYALVFKRGHSQKCPHARVAKHAQTHIGVELCKLKCQLDLLSELI